MKKPLFYLIGLMLMQITGVSAQEKNSWKVDFRTDIFSRHLWRGDQLGDSPAFEPEITLSKGNFGLSIWGAATFNNSYNETDIILNYQFMPFLNITFYDYYNPMPDIENKFWSYIGDEMRHTLELTADLENGNFPLTLLTGVFIYGDKDSVSNNERFSTYIEPGFNFRIAQNDFRLFAGFTPFGGYYAEKFAFINIGATFSDSFSVAPKLELPFEISFCTNPYTNKTWFVVAFGIKNSQNTVKHPK